MKLAYAFRRSTFYPFTAGAAWALPDGDALTGYLDKVRGIGFDGIELGLDSFGPNGGMDADERGAGELKRRLDDAGTPCVAIRAGGALHHPDTADHNRKRLERAARIAGWLGAGIVNTALSSPARSPDEDTGPSGARRSHGSSRDADDADFALAADALRAAGAMAGELGADITVEVHQHSIADNSRSTLRLLDMADSPYVHANPDLGNVLWNYDEPEETSEECIAALAGRSKYWHCKSLHRVQVPQLEHSYYIRVPLPDGDIDYRFAMSAMADAGYGGYMAIEGANTGDQLHKDARSVEYARGLMAELGV